MRPASKGVTRAFIRVDGDREALIADLKRVVGGAFTGRIQGVIRTKEGELELVIEVLRGRIVAAGVDGYVRAEGGSALNIIAKAILEGTGFLEIVDLSEEGVNLDLEFNPGSKLSMPSSLELYINRIELRLQRRRAKEGETPTKPVQEEERYVSPRLREEKTPIGAKGSEKANVTQVTSVRTAGIETRESKSTTRVPRRQEPTEKEKAPTTHGIVGRGETYGKMVEEQSKTSMEPSKGSLLEQIGLDEEVLGDLVVNVRDKPVVIEAIPSEGGRQSTPATVDQASPKDIIGGGVMHKPNIPMTPEEKVQRVQTVKVEAPSEEEILSKIPLNEKLEDYSKTLLTDRDRLILSLIEVSEVLDHGKGRVDAVLDKIINMSKNRDEPLKLSTSIAGKLYYVIVHRGLVVSAFKIDEATENTELYGRQAIVDMVKKSLLSDIEYVISLVKNEYILYTLGILKKEEVEQRIEERAEGLIGRLRRIFGGHK